MNHTESKIVRQVIADLIDAGYAITVDDGMGSSFIRRSRDADAVYAAMGAMGEDVLHVTNPNAVIAASFIHLIYGNDTDVISDMGVSLDPVLARSTRLAEHLAREAW